MVGQHDAPRAHANGLSRRSKMTDYNRGGRAGNARHIVVLGDPIPFITPGFRLNSELFTALKSAPCVATKGNRN